MNATVKVVRDALPAGSRERSTAKGLVYFVAAATAYALTFVAIAWPANWLARLGVAVMNGLVVGVLFIVGHDACHGSLTPHSTLNKWLGRLAFLPSLHPLAAWEYSHNALHHGWTNLRGKDPVYCPLTMEEFRALPPRARQLERMYRTWLGLLPLYLDRIWWSLEIAPNAAHRANIDKRGTFAFDRALVLLYPPVQALALLGSLSTGSASALEAVGVVGIGVVVPFLAFTWLIGFATFQHHTHPRVLWYAGEAEWTFFRSQVQGTVHIEFPRWIEVLLANIMEHTAHHVDPKIPLYNLTKAQDALEQAFGEENVVVEPFSLAALSATFRTCQLYDYDRHCWLSFDGTPTTAPRSLACESQLSPAISS